MEIPVRKGRYAPRKLTSPRAESIFLELVSKDAQGNITAMLECPDAAEVRFHKPSGTTNYQITVRGRLTDGEGDEWVIIVPPDRMGILFVPQGFSADQSVMGAIYRLTEPRNIRILADQMIQMPGLNFTVQLL